jgi:ABC-type uncharacterized transport system substrate-binding protein
VIPIVFTGAADPVTAGLVASLSRPGGNATGATSYLNDLGAKRLELLRDVVPKATTIGMLVNPNIPDIELQRRDVEEAARKFGQQVHVGNAASVDDFDRVLAAFVRLNASALLEPISKLFEEDNEAGKLDKAKEIVGVVLPANEDPALPLNPGEEALDEPASHVAA